MVLKANNRQERAIIRKQVEEEKHMVMSALYARHQSESDLSKAAMRNCADVRLPLNWVDQGRPAIL